MLRLSHPPALAHAQHAVLTVQACNTMQAAPSSDTAGIAIIRNKVSPIQAKTGPPATIRIRNDAQKAFFLSFLFTALVALIWFFVTLSKEHHDVMMQALTSLELRSRLSKQGKRFQQQLTERGALHQLMTAIQSGDSDAKLQLFGITKVHIIPDNTVI